MALSRFPTVMNAAVSAIIVAADALRYLRDAQGDMTWRSLDAVQDALRTAKVTTMDVFTEAPKQIDTAQAYMASIGGPASLADYQSAVIAIETAASAWNDHIVTFIAGLPVDTVIGVVTRSVDSITTRHIERSAFVPAIHADPLRTSPELAALIASFEAVGA